MTNQNPIFDEAEMKRRLDAGESFPAALRAAMQEQQRQLDEAARAWASATQGAVSSKLGALAETTTPSGHYAHRATAFAEAAIMISCSEPMTQVDIVTKLADRARDYAGMAVSSIGDTWSAPFRGVDGSPDLAGARRGDWMQTFTGRQFWPLDPRPEEVDLVDVAHSLGHQCRYGGHSRRFYSVAEHCILVSLFMPTRELALYALLHDAAEAYVVDVPRPLKRHLPGYAQIENRVLEAVFDRVGVDREHHAPELGGLIRFPAEVTDADNRILLDERAQLLSTPPAPWGIEDLEPLGVGIDALTPARATEAYLARLESLGVQL